MSHLLFSRSFSPSQIAGLNGWWRADAINGLVDNDPVATWIDSSGNAYDLTQGTAGFRPTYQTLEQNGLPIVRFDNSDDLLRSQTTLTLLSASAGTVFSVFKTPAVFTTGDTVWLVNAAATDQAAVYLVSAATIRNMNYDGTEDLVDKGSIGASTWVISTWMHSAGTLYTGVSDTRTASLSSIASGNTSTVTNSSISLGLGRGSAFGSDMAEAILYNTALTEDERKSVEQYLGNKWNIALPY